MSRLLADLPIVCQSLVDSPSAHWGSHVFAEQGGPSDSRPLFARPELKGLHRVPVAGQSPSVWMFKHSLYKAEVASKGRYGVDRSRAIDVESPENRSMTKFFHKLHNTTMSVARSALICAFECLPTARDVLPCHAASHGRTLRDHRHVPRSWSKNHTQPNRSVLEEKGIYYTEVFPPHRTYASL